MRKHLKALIFILITQAAGIIGSLFTLNSIESWYAGLVKPVFTPPNWLFGPVWITLYTLLGISIFLIWEKRDDVPEAKKAIKWFFAHLVLNAIWTPLFFGAQLVLVALLVLISILITGVYVLIKFYRIKKIAGYLLIPYIAWIIVALYLNSGIYILN
ncbi:MAG: TspO/MBR family protein [Candidatus Spechtbacterales bacterium]|nr:TspO/MBR family protein [Candidatus Spechtbacterales bacterium]